MQQVKVIVRTEDEAACMVEILSIEGDEVARVEIVGLERDGYLWTLRDSDGTWLAEGKVGTHDCRSSQERSLAIWRAFFPPA